MRLSRMLEPIQPARRAVSGQRLSFLDDLADEKVLGHDEEIDDRKRLQIVVHE